MARKFVDQHKFHELAGRGEATGVGLARVATFEPRIYEDGTRKIRFCFSDGSEDRMGDTISPYGWELSGFMKNPIALWAHDALSPPIGRASNISVEGDRLMGTIEFASPDVYPFAETIYRMVRERFISAVSVGFIPIEYSFSKDKDRQFGIDFERQELVEISLVPVPANANALVEGRAKGYHASQLGDRDYRIQTIKRLGRTGRRIQAAAQTNDVVIEASRAGCAIDRLRERDRKEQHDQLRREVTVLRLGLRPGDRDYRTHNELSLARVKYLSQLADEWWP